MVADQHESPDATAQREIDRLRTDNAHLLDELETAYVQMERALSAADYETQITYEELRDRNDELQHRLDELEDTNAQLRETRTMLLHAERLTAMGQMAAAIVHEINSPLAVITGQVELLLMREPEESLKADLNTVLRAAWRLRDLARNILRFSRQRQAETSHVDLNEITSSVLGFMRPLMKSVTVGYEPADDLPRLAANGSQLEQVLVNLVRNALDAMAGRTGSRIHITTGTATLEELMARETRAGWRSFRALGIEEQEQSASWLYVEVGDNGAGIDTRELGDIFEPFHTTKREGKGTGLGLAISRSIVQDHHGDISVSSRLGEGTVFTVLLPLDAGSP